MDKIYIVMDYVEHDLKSLMETMKDPFMIGRCSTGLIRDCYSVYVVSYMLVGVMQAILCHTCYLVSYMLLSVSCVIHITWYHTCYLVSYMLYCVIHVVWCILCHTHYLVS